MIAGKLSIALIVKWLLLCGWGALFFGGVTHYSGSWLAYTAFSFVFLTMLLSGLYRQVSYGYLYLTIMLWLGFWLKLTVHLIVDYPYSEPLGFFVGTSDTWDEVLLVATVGGVGVLLARLLYGLFGDSSTMLVSGDGFKSPAWYPSVRKWMWLLLMVLCIGLAIINSIYGILNIGLVPKVIFLWPLNAVISWLIGYGLTLGIATLLWWDIALKINISSVVYFILLEAFASTVSILSRGAYLFHSIPQFLAIYKNSNKINGWSVKNIIMVFVVFVALFAISNPLVNSLRENDYSDRPLGGNVANDVADDMAIIGRISSLAKFSVDRWIGLEGVMAVSAYQNKGGDLIIQGLSERAEIGKYTIYQEISQAHYRFMDMSKFQFGTLPGAIAFLYFSGALWLVALGMVALVVFLLVSERFVFVFTNNPLLSSLWGGSAANAVAQIGSAPRSYMVYLFEMVCGITIICILQSDSFNNFLKRIALLKWRVLKQMSGRAG